VTLGDLDGTIHQFDLRETRTLPSDVLASVTSQPLIIHNAAFDLRFLASKFGLWPEHVFCTLTASRLLEPLKSSRHSYGAVVERYLDVKLAKEYGASDWGSMMLTADQMKYARDDVRYLHKLALTLESELAEDDLTHIFEMECALLPIITRMEMRGFAIDLELVRSMLPREKERASSLAGRIRAAFDAADLNPNSPEQVQEAFKQSGIDLENTEEETLCAIDDPRAQMVLDYRGTEKLINTLESLLENQRGGRIYAQFNPLGAVSGRFSSKGPNLQQIPRGAVRAAFVASAPDRRLIVADYSQIELRVAALIAGESVMIDAFKSGTDLHTLIAASSLRIALEQVTKAQRNIGKTINFGFIYGRSAQGYRRGVRKDYGLILTPAEILSKVVYRGLAHPC
jgi:DNA polymerase I